jgi:hypothetical protein
MSSNPVRGRSIAGILFVWSLAVRLDAGPDRKKREKEVGIMSDTKIWGKVLLWVHLFIVCIWLLFFRMAATDPGDGEGMPMWIAHIFILSILAIQFTWGFTVGLNVGPSRKKRDNLWWSLLTIFLPIWFYNFVVKIMALLGAPLWALVYGAVFIVILGCETYCGVLLGVKAHAEAKED